MHILHDFYLIAGSPASYFSFSDAERQQILINKLRASQYNILRDFQLLLSQDDLSKMRNYKLRLLESPTGFNLAIEVKSERALDGSVRYRPAISLPEDLQLNIGLKLTNPLFGNITNLRLRDSNQNIYLFTNNGLHVGKTLSKPVPQLTSGEDYLMGDLASIEGVVHQAIENNNGDRLKWVPIPGNGYVNTEDKILNPEEEWFKEWMLSFANSIRIPFGIMKLHFHSTDSDSTLLDEEGFLVTRKESEAFRATNQRFEVRFLSRSSYWRYQKKEGLSDEEVDHLKTVAPYLEQQDRRFVSKEPRYMAQALTFFEDTITILPNPTPDMLKSEGSKYYSDIFFNKATPIP